MAERSTISTACIVAAALAAGTLGGFGASLLRSASLTPMTHPELVMLTGSGVLPPGDKVFCAPPSAVLTLNPHARIGEVQHVIDCENGATRQPIKIRPSSEAPIRGAYLEDDGSFELSLDGRGMGFLRVPDHWQEF